jgi:hypothetical protein
MNTREQEREIIIRAFRAYNDDDAHCVKMHLRGMLSANNAERVIKTAHARYASIADVLTYVNMSRYATIVIDVATLIEIQWQDFVVEIISADDLRDLAGDDVISADASYEISVYTTRDDDDRSRPIYRLESKIDDSPSQVTFDALALLMRANAVNAL